MRFYTVTAAFGAFLLPLVSGECYSDKIDKANTKVAHDNIDNVAKFLQGTLVGRQERGTCVTDIATGSQWYFGLRSMKDTEQQVSKYDIAEYLNREVNGCGQHGGFRKEGDVEYKYVLSNILREVQAKC